MMPDPLEQTFLDRREAEADTLQNGTPDKLEALCRCVAGLTHVVTATVRRSVTKEDCDRRYAALRKEKGQGESFSFARSGPMALVSLAISSPGWVVAYLILDKVGKARGWW